MTNRHSGITIVFLPAASIWGRGCLWPHLACLQGPDGVGGVDEGHVLRRLSGQRAAARGADIVDQEVEAGASHLLPHLPDRCLDAVGICHVCKGTGQLGDRLEGGPVPGKML